MKHLPLKVQSRILLGVVGLVLLYPRPSLSGDGSSGGDGKPMHRKLESLFCGETANNRKVCVLGNVQTGSYYLAFDGNVLPAELKSELFSRWSSIRALEVKVSGPNFVVVKHQLAFRQDDSGGKTYSAVWTYDKLEKSTGKWLDYFVFSFRMNRGG